MRVRQNPATLLIVALLLLLCASRSSDAATLGLVWDPPTDGITTGYVVRYGTTPGNYAQSVNVGMATSHSITTLADGVTYYFVVQAYNSSGQFGPMSSEVAGTTRPAAPVNLAAGVSGATATLTWQAPGGTVTGYRIEVGTTTGQSNVTTIDTGAVTTYAINTLAAGSYYMRVRSLNNAGASAPSNEIVVTLGQASLPAPTSLTGTARSGQYIDLSWTAPSATVTGYRVEVGSSSGQSNVTSANTGTATTYTLSGLSAGTYYIRVRSVNGSTVSGPSNEISVTLASAPGAPTALVAVVRDNQSIDLNWQPAAGTVTGYRVEVGTAAGQSNVTTATIGNVTTHTLSGLAVGTYYIRLRALNGSLVSNPSNEVTATLVAAPPPPSALVAVVRENQYIDLNWQPPTGTVTGYRVEVGTAAGQSNVTTATTGNVTTHTLSGLAPGTYYIRLRTINSAGVSSPSNEATATIATTSMPAPRNLTAGVRNGTTLDLTWEAPATSVQGYRVDIGTSPGQSNVRIATVDASVTNLVVNDLRGGPYHVRVRSVAGSQVSEPSNEVQALLAPSAPTSLSNAVRKQRFVDLWWRAPATGAAAYSIEIGTTTGGSDVRIIQSTATSYTISDLPNGTFYIRVRGINSAGTGPASNEVRVNVARSTVKPLAPANLTATLRDTKLFDLTWEADEDAQYYRVEVGTEAGKTDVSSFTTGVTSTFSIGELPAQRYFVRVRAANDLGISDPSNEVVLAGAGGTDAPRRLAGSVTSGGVVRLTWDAPSDPTGVTGYVVEAGAGPGRADLGTISTHGHAFASGPVPNGTYFVRVRSVTAAGPGAASNEVVLHVGESVQCSAPPAAPRLSTTVIGTLVEMSWAPGMGDAPTGYVLDVGSSPGRRDILSMPLGAEITTLTTQAQNGTYALRLIAVNSCGASTWGTDTTVTIGGPELALPGAPTNLTQQVNGRSATLNWVPATSGGETTSYRIEVLAPNGVPILTLDTGNLSTTFTHGAVPPGQYTVHVRGLNARGAGAPTNAVVVTVQ